MLSNVTPQTFSHQTCLPKYMTINIGPWFLQARVVAEAPWLDFELHCMGADVYIPGH